MSAVQEITAYLIEQIPVPPPFWVPQPMEIYDQPFQEKLGCEELQRAILREDLNQESIRGTNPSLDDTYVIGDRKRVLAFVDENRLRGLLNQAIKPLSACFGERLKVLTLASDDEGAETLFCLVKWRDNLQDARTALKSFDEQWWLAKCAQIGGKINFDFDLV